MDALETALMLSPAMGLLDVTENKSIAKKSSYSEIGTLKKTCGILVKKLDLVAVGWPACLHIVASGQGRR